MIEPDQRDFHTHHRTVADKEVVMKHIRQFKVVESHYVREFARYEYLSEELTVSTTHDIYVKWCDENDYKVKNYSFFARVFREKFNLKFQKWKKDACDSCKIFKNTPPEHITEAMKNSHENHIQQKTW